MENNDVNLNSFLQGYLNVDKKIRDMGGEDNTLKIENLRREIDDAEKKINEMQGKKGEKLSIKEFEKRSKPYMEKIRDNEKMVHDLEAKKEEIKNDPEKAKQLAELNFAKRNIRDSAKTYMEEQLQKIEEEYKSKEEEYKKLNYEYQAILDTRKSDPHRAYDEKYKEFVKQKIAKTESSMQQDLQREKECKHIYTDLVKNFARIDRGENVVISGKIIDEAFEENKKRKQDRKVDVTHDIKTRKNVSSKDINEQELEDEEVNSLDVNNEIRENVSPKDISEQGLEGGEVNSLDMNNDNIKISIGNKGEIIFNGQKFKTSRWAMRDSYDLTKEDMIFEISNISTNIDNELVTHCVNKGMVDPAVINAVIRNKRMSDSIKESVLNAYLVECEHAMKGEKIEGKVDLTYSLDKLSKVGGMPVSAKAKLTKRAINFAERGFGKVMGEYKPKLLSKIACRLMGQKLPQLSEMNSTQLTESDLDAAYAYDQLKTDNKEEYAEFIDTIRVDVDHLEKDKDGRETMNTRAETIELDDSAKKTLQELYDQDNER